MSENVHITIDAMDSPTIRTFWRAVLGYREVGDGDLDVPRTAGPQSGSSRWTFHERSAIVFISTSTYPTTQSSPAWRRRSPREGDLSPTCTRHGGGFSRIVRATKRAS